MDKKYYCTIRDKTISKNQKARHEKTDKHKIKKAVGGDLQTMSSKLPNFPWSKYSGEHHLPSHSFTGPETRLDIRLDKNMLPKSGEEPYNKVDSVALNHDIRYTNANQQDDLATTTDDQEILNLKHDADRIMLDELEKIQTSGVSEWFAKQVAKIAIGAKLKLGIGLDENI